MAESQQLARLVDAVRAAVRLPDEPVRTARRVERALRVALPTPDLLTPRQIAGDPDDYTQHVLYCDASGSFSIVALVWLPGQRTPVHDHLAWCVVGVIAGMESETRYQLSTADGQPCLVETGTRRNPVGTVCGFAPPGDIHEVRNAGTDTAVSIHVYGADIRRVGSSVRRRYALPVLARRPAS